MDEHELGERLLISRSRWEGVEGYQNVSAVKNGARQIMVGGHVWCKSEQQH